MKPEYKFNVEKLTDKEQVVNGLMNSGYIVSCQQKFGYYEISVYGKERVDGKGQKNTEWFDKMDNPQVSPVPFIIKTHPNTIDDMIVKTPYIPPTTAYFGAPSITTLTNVSVEDKEKEIETIVKAIERNYGC